MKRCLLLLFALTLLGPGARAQDLAPGLSAETFKAVDQMVSKAMLAYNGDDWKTFYADFAKAMAALASEQNFKVLYQDRYKKQFGNLKSKELDKAHTSIMANNGAIQYLAVFDKGPAKLQVNIMKEGNGWKLQQVQINK